MRHISCCQLDQARRLLAGKKDYGCDLGAVSARALGELIGLFSWMVEETAEHIQHPLSLDFQDRVRDWIESELRKIV